MQPRRPGFAVRATVRPRRLLAAAVNALFLAVLMTPASATAETTLERIARTGVVRIGYAAEAPFAFRAPDGQLDGIGPVVAQRVFAAMGVHEVRGVESEFGALLRDLRSGRFDVIAVGMFVLPERCRQALFSEPMFKAGPGFAVRSGNPKHLHGFEDVARDSSVNLGVVAGAVELEQARASGVAEDRLVIFPDAATAAAGVKAGRVDAYAAMALTVRRLAQQSPRQLESAEPFHNPTLPGGSAVEHGAFAFRPEDGDLRDAFNTRLGALLRTPDYLALVAPFGLTLDDLPDRPTSELCAQRTRAR